MLRIIITIFAFSLASLVMGQGFSGKTNDIAVNFKRPTVGAVILPHIDWMTPKMEFTHSVETAVQVEAVVVSETPLMSVRVVVSNGDVVRGSKSVPLTTGKSTLINQRVVLSDGTNTVKIIAETTSGGQVSSTRAVSVGEAAMANVLAIDRKDYALLFATDNYDNWSDLVNPIDDARSIAKVLQEKYGFITEIVENANVDEVFSKLRDYAERKYKPQDQLLVFFAGHGQFDEITNEGFVVAKNSLADDKAKTSYISHNRLRGIAQNLPSEHVLLMMDVCFGGTFDPVVASARGAESAQAANAEYLVRKFSQRTRKYLTSGGKEYVSDGIPGKHSPFTLRLLQAFADGGGSDRLLTLAELKTYVEKIRPEPRSGSFGDDNSQSDFVFVPRN